MTGVKLFPWKDFVSTSVQGRVKCSPGIAETKQKFRLRRLTIVFRFSSTLTFEGLKIAKQYLFLVTVTSSIISEPKHNLVASSPVTIATAYGSK